MRGVRRDANVEKRSVCVMREDVEEVVCVVQVKVVFVKELRERMSLEVQAGGHLASQVSVASHARVERSMRCPSTTESTASCQILVCQP